MDKGANFSGSYVPFTNYHYAFISFHDKYKLTFYKISETMNLYTIGKYIATFMFEFASAVPDPHRWIQYKKELEEINTQLDADDTIQKLNAQSELTFKEEVRAYPLYYSYFIKYLSVFSKFTVELTATYMPRTKLQQSLLKFKSDNAFQEKLHEFKTEVFENLGTFTIQDFRLKFNFFILYYHAYKLFLSENAVKEIERLLSISLSLFLDDETIRILENYPDISSNDRLVLNESECCIFEALQECNKIINESFSNSNIIPKLTPRKFTDRTLI